MAGYRRFIAYVYEYRKGKKGNNCGFIKVEVRDGQCRLEVHLQCPGLSAQMECRIYGFVRNGGLIDGNLLNVCRTNDGIVECLIETDALNMSDTGVGIGKMGGLILKTESGAFFGTEWDDIPIRPENFREIKANRLSDAERSEDRMEKNRQEIKSYDSDEETGNLKKIMTGDTEQKMKLEVGIKPTTENLTESEKNVSAENQSETESRIKSLTAENLSEPKTRMQTVRTLEAENWIEPEKMVTAENRVEPESNGEFQNRSAEETHTEPENQMTPDKTVHAKNTEKMQTKADKTGEKREEDHAKEQQEEWRKEQQKEQQKSECPFGDGELAECRRIQLKDLVHLNRRDAALRNNRFLQYGYYNFGHLLIGKRQDGRYILGVPGGYDQQERFMAGMFGFPYFRESRHIQLPKGRGGYWYRLINTPDFH